MPIVEWVENIQKVPRTQEWFGKVDVRKSEPTAILKYKTKNGRADILVLVRLSGYYPANKNDRWAAWNTITDAQVKLSMNSTAHFTFEELDRLVLAVTEARDYLQKKYPQA